MNRRLLRSTLIRLVLAWVLLTLVATLAGAKIIVQFRGAIEFGVETLMPGFIATVSEQAPSARQGDIAVSVHAYEPVALAGDYSIPRWMPITESIDAGHDLVALVLLLSIVAAWPCSTFSDRLRLLALALPLCVLLAIATVALHFSGLYEISFQRTAQAIHLNRERPSFMPVFLFSEAGGVWMLATAIALTLGFSVTSRSRRFVPGA